MSFPSKADPSDYPQRPHTFMVADISGYSTFAERYGDEAAADLAIRLVGRASSMASEHGAEVTKRIGDAVFFHAVDADKAVRLGLDLLTELDGGPAFPPIRLGVHTGPALHRADDWWGATVNIAALVAAAAKAGQMLVTESTKRAAGQLDRICLRALGLVYLKNLSSPMRVYSASLIPASRRCPTGSTWPRGYMVRPTTAELGP